MRALALAVVVVFLVSGAAAYGFDTPLIVGNCSSQDIVFLDVNKDNVTDVIGACAGLGTVYYLRSANGSFSSYRFIDSIVGYLTTGDMNRDGLNDLIITTFFDVFIYTALPLGGFSSPVSVYQFGTSCVCLRVATVDFNNDGWLDAFHARNCPQPGIAILIWNPNTTAFYEQAVVGNYIGNVLYWMTWATFADFNGDGYSDVLYLDYYLSLVGIHINLNGTAWAAVQTIASVPNIHLRFALLGDLNLDGRLDIVGLGGLGQFYPDIAFLYSHAGGGGILYDTTAVILGVEYGVARGGALVDLNRDGFLDLVYSASASINFIPNINGTLAAGLWVSLAAMPGLQWVQALDVDGDSAIDFLLASITDARLYFMRTKYCVASAAVPNSPSAIAAAVYPASVTVNCSANYVSASSNTSRISPVTCDGKLWQPTLPCVPDPSCPIVPALSTGTVQPAAQVVGGMVNVTLVPRNFMGVPLRCGDVWGLVIPPGATGMTLVVAAESATTIAVLFTVAVGSRAGAFALAPLVSGVAAPAITLTVLPGAPLATTALLDCGAACNSTFSNSVTTFTVTVRDAYGNVQPAGAAVAGTMYLAKDGSVVTFTVARIGGALYGISFSLPAGLYALSVTVDGLPIGAPVSAFVIDICQPGTFVQLNGLCSPCAINTYSSAISATACLACPAGTSTASRLGAASITNCTCLEGFYTLAASAVDGCLRCPVGAVCPGGGSLPLPLTGWNFNGALDAFAQCPRARSCPGGASRESNCAAGYRGFMCKDCAPGYRPTNGYAECTACPPATGSLLGTYLAAIVAMAVLSTLLIALSSKRKASSRVGAVPDGGVETAGPQHGFVDEGPGADGLPAALPVETLRQRCVPPTLSIAVSALQVAGVLGMGSFAWPASVSRSLSMVNLAVAFDVSTFASECALDSFAVKYILSMAMPLVFTVVLVLCTVALMTLRRIRLAAVLLTTLFSAGPLAYLPLSRATLVLFACTKLPDGRYYLDANLSVQCFVGGWLTLLPIGLAGVATYVLLIPGVMVGALLGHRRRLFTDAAVFQTHAPLYSLFRRPMYLTGIALLLMQLAVSAISLFAARLPVLQAFLYFVVVVLGGVAQFKLGPYYAPFYETYTALLRTGLTLILVCGMLFLANAGSAVESTGGNIDAQQSTTTTAVSVVFFAAMALLVVGIVAGVALDVMSIARDRARAARRRKLGPDAVSDSAYATPQFQYLGALVARLEELPEGERARLREMFGSQAPAADLEVSGGTSVALEEMSMSASSFGASAGARAADVSAAAPVKGRAIGLGSARVRAGGVQARSERLSGALPAQPVGWPTQ